MTTAALRVLSSMATRHVLAERIAAFRAAAGIDVALTAIGGVDAARRVREGEAFDVVVLAADAVDALQCAGRLHAETRLDWVDSGVAVAVPVGAPLPDLSSEAAVREAVVAAPRIGVSTGPSGVALDALFARWGLAEALATKLVRAPAGVPVATLLVRREVDLGFQQLSELIGADGLVVVGPLPDAIQISTTFTAAVAATSTDVAVAEAFLRSLADPAAADAIRRHGMTPSSRSAAP